VSAAAIEKVTLADDWRSVGAGYSVQFTFKDGAAHAEWSPTLPIARDFPRIEAGYFAARHRFLTALAERVGGTVLCIEGAQ
jgi:hypothetical protein